MVSAPVVCTLSSAAMMMLEPKQIELAALPAVAGARVERAGDLERGQGARITRAASSGRRGRAVPFWLAMPVR